MALSPAAALRAIRVLHTVVWAFFVAAIVAVNLMLGLLTVIAGASGRFW